MIPEEELFSAQDAYAQAGRESGVPFAVPSREALRGSGVSALRRMFSQTAAEGEAAARPQQVAGMFGLERERIAQRGGIERAALEEAAAASRAELGHSRNLERQRELQEAITGRTRETQESIGERASGTQAGLASRQRLNDLMVQRRALMTQQQRQGPGFFDRLRGRDPLQDQINEISMQIDQLSSGGGGVDVGGGDEDVVELDLTPEQLANLQSMLGGQ
jgi:hypothetical protein